MEGSQRKRIENINTFKQACDLIRDSKNIVVLTGAGISVPCGVPDFRSRNGIYARLAVDFPDLDEPQSMFDIHYFSKNPKPFFKFAKVITIHVFYLMYDARHGVLRYGSGNRLKQFSLRFLGDLPWQIHPIIGSQIHQAPRRQKEAITELHPEYRHPRTSSRHQEHHPLSRFD